jgi:hypothetical protein
LQGQDSERRTDIVVEKRIGDPLEQQPQQQEHTPQSGRPLQEFGNTFFSDEQSLALSTRPGAYIRLSEDLPSGLQVAEKASTLN